VEVFINILCLFLLAKSKTTIVLVDEKSLRTLVYTMKVIRKHFITTVSMKEVWEFHLMQAETKKPIKRHYSYSKAGIYHVMYWDLNLRI
jgi:hypothetical protein